MELKLKKISRVSTKHFIDLVMLARSRSLLADTIIKVVKESDERLFIELWRREGGKDVFDNPRISLFDRFAVRENSVKCAPKGVITEADLIDLGEKGVCDIFLTASIISEENLPKVIEQISSIYGFIVYSETVRKIRNEIPEIVVEI